MPIRIDWTPSKHGLLYAIAILCSQIAWAEIVITVINPPTNAERAKASANQNRANALAQRENGMTTNDADTPVVVLPPDADIVFIDAPSNSDKSSKHLRRAKSYRIGDGSKDSESDLSDHDNKANTAEVSATRNQNRAISYRRGDKPVVGAGNADLPVVACKDTNNIVGRIGDDNQSGKIIYLVKGQQKIKVRCL